MCRDNDLLSIEQKIKDKAMRLGFALCGITKARRLGEDEHRFKDWLSEGFAADMSFLKRNIDKRFSADKLLNGGKSVICVGLAYEKVAPPPQSQCVISSYACYEDYHIVIKQKLFALADFIESIADSGAKFKACVDSVPIAERAYSHLAGLGFIGKNKMLINPEIGSRLFLGELITDLPLESDLSQVSASCKDCRKCIDACPTGALTEYALDCRKCLSYLTIEHKSDLPQEYKSLASKYIFGCDKCVDACPYNHSTVSNLKAIIKSGFKAEEILEMETADFENYFGKTPVVRAGLDKLKSHIKPTL